MHKKRLHFKGVPVYNTLFLILSPLAKNRLPRGGPYGLRRIIFNLGEENAEDEDQKQRQKALYCDRFWPRQVQASQNASHANEQTKTDETQSA